MHVSVSGSAPNWIPSANFDISDCSVINIDCTNIDTIAETMYGIVIIGANNFRVERNYIKFSVTNRGTNEAIALASAGQSTAALSHHGIINANHCDGSGVQADGHNMKVTNNVIHDFKFGGGITFNLTDDPNDPLLFDTIHDNEIIGNTIYKSTGIDVNDTWPNGIENWGKRTIISGNVCYDNSGSGIATAGLQCIVTNNICYNNGAGVAAPHVNHDRAGIELLYRDDTFNVSESVIVGNRCFDTRTGSSRTQLYGIQDDSDTGSAPYSSNVTIGVNSLLGNATAPSNIHGSNYAILNPITGGGVVLSAPPAAPADGELNNSNVSFFLDEGADELKIRVKYSDGVTFKTGTIMLT